MCFVFKVMIILMMIVGTATAIILLKFPHEEKPAGVVDEGVPVAPVVDHQDHPEQAGQAQLDVAHTPALDDGLVPVADPGLKDVLDQGDDQLEVGQDVEDQDNKNKNRKYIPKYILVGIAGGILGMAMFIMFITSFACQKCCRAGPPPMPPPQNPTAPSSNPLHGLHLGPDIERLLAEAKEPDAKPSFIDCWPQFDDRMNYLGFVRDPLQEKTPPDGDCALHAISAQVY